MGFTTAEPCRAKVILPEDVLYYIGNIIPHSLNFSFDEAYLPEHFFELEAGLFPLDKAHYT